MCQFMSLIDTIILLLEVHASAHFPLLIFPFARITTCFPLAISAVNSKPDSLGARRVLMMIHPSYLCSFHPFLLSF